MTKRGVDAARAMGADLMTLWLGQDGFDYNFQLDYAEAWDLEIAGIARSPSTIRPARSRSSTSPTSRAPMRSCATARRRCWRSARSGRRTSA